ncbi:retrotransposon protein, putative, ty1-copia subclass [Tanacetum coccineum]
MFVIKQPLPAAPAADSQAQVFSKWNAVYDAYNEVACLILGSMTPELHRQFENSSSYDMIKELKSMFEKQAGMKGYVDQLECLGYMLPQDLIVGLILNNLTKDFVGFMRNYNIHNIGKTIGELHAMLIEYEKDLPKKAETPQVMMIKGGGGSLEEELSLFILLILFEEQVGTASSSDRDGEYISQEFKDYLKACGIIQQLTPSYTPQHNGMSEKINRTLLDMVRSMMNLTTLPLSFWDYALESVIRILNMVPTKKVDKTPYELWYGKVLNLSYLKVWDVRRL